jgi:hypothetical protein
MDDLLEQALAKATAKGQKKAAKLATEMANERKAKVAGWQERQRARKAQEREERVKDGRTILEAFVQEVAEPYLRLCAREDVDKIKDLRVLFIPGKCDQAGSSSAAIMDGHKRVSTIYKSSLQQKAEKQRWQLERLQEKTGFSASSPAEMMEEIARLQEELAEIKRGRDGRQTVCLAARDVLLAWAEGRDIKGEMDNLEEAFQK